MPERLLIPCRALFGNPERSTRRISSDGLHLSWPAPRDGLDLAAYVTLPADPKGERPPEPLPTALSVHGGPWARDACGFDPAHQGLPAGTSRPPRQYGRRQMLESRHCVAGRRRLRGTRP